MRVWVDQDLCQGHALCAEEAPAVFRLRDSDGHAYVVVDEVPPEHRESAERAVLGCPEQAIMMED